MNYEDLLKRTSELAIEFLDTLEERPVGRPVDWTGLLAELGGELPTRGEDSLPVIEE